MPIEITLPKLSDTMEEGKILRWLKRVGDQVAPGDVVAEVETDKADMEVEASDGGIVSEIRVQEGESAPVGAVLAVLGGQPRAAGAAKRPAEARPVRGADEREEGKRPPAQGAGDDSEARGAPVPQRARPTPIARATPAVRSAPPLAKSPGGAPKLRASPLAQRLARERGLNLAQVQGSGSEGKIVRRDVDRAPAEPEPRRGEELAPGRRELSKMRQSIARRMTEAKQGIPHFYVAAEIDMGEAMRLLEALKQQVDSHITVSHLVVKAAAMALQEHPRVNGQWLDGAVEIPASINIGIAVAVEDGLIVPVVHGCEALALRDIAIEARRLVEAARQGGFSGDDLRGGTFSISNLGILDVDEFSAIINPPQAAILAVGSIKERAVARQGQLAVARTMRVTLSCDHRQLNGVEGARYLETLKAILETPLRMIV